MIRNRHLALPVLLLAIIFTLVALNAQPQGTTAFPAPGNTLPVSTWLQSPAPPVSDRFRPTSSAITPVCGDLTGDQTLNVFDVIIIFRIVVAQVQPDLVQQVLSDLNRDGATNVLDAVLALQHTVGHTTVTRCGPPVIVAITSPPSLRVFNKTEVPITVSGVISGPVIGVTVNDVPAMVSEGTFTAAGVSLREGNNAVTAVAEGLTGDRSTSSVQVTLDTTPPTVVIETPRDGLLTADAVVTVAGSVNDMVTGTVNGEDVTIRCNNRQATVQNRAFALVDLVLRPGPNTVRCVATDHAGNDSQSQPVQVMRQEVGGQRILHVSGNNQSGPVNDELPQPLTVRLVDSQGSPVAGRKVTFQVTRGSGTLRASPEEVRQVEVLTDADGLASAFITLGSRSGAGNQRVTATALGFVGEVEFCATATPAPAHMIIAAAGETQTGAVAEPLPLPLLAVVFDRDGNPINGVPVTFAVSEGSGNIGGQGSVMVPTDDDGRAAVALTLGANAGINTNVVEATFPGLEGLPATFVASAREPGRAEDTTVSGVLLDNANQPIPGAIASIKGTDLIAITDEQGLFTIRNVPVGALHLLVDGSTSPRPETFPMLEYSMVTVSGQDNTVGRPILMPALDVENSKICGGDEECVLQMGGVPGMTLTVAPHSITSGGQPYVGPVIFTQVHADDVPMLPPNGGIPAPAGTIQPGAEKGGNITLHFSPPARLTAPNALGLPPGSQGEIFVFDHDLEEFASVGTGTVTEDGSMIVSDPGYGITKSGWFCAICMVPDPAKVKRYLFDGMKWGNLAIVVFCLLQPELCPGIVVSRRAAKSLALQTVSSFTDPPDANYTEITEPKIPELPQPIPPGGIISQAQADILNAIVENLDKIKSYADATLIAFDRFEGARLAGDEFWQNEQASAAMRFMRETAPLIEEESRLLLAWHDAVLSDGIELQVTERDILDIQEFTAVYGLPSELLNALRQLPIDPGDIDAIEQMILEADATEIAALGDGMFPQALIDTKIMENLQDGIDGLNNVDLLDGSCTVSALNRSVSVDALGRFTIENIPADGRIVRVFANCDGFRGHSGFIALTPGGTVRLDGLIFSSERPATSSLLIASPVADLISAGANAQLTVTGTLSDGSTPDLTSQDTGTTYTSSNPAIATVSQDGLVTAVSSGTAIISARNDGVLATIPITVALANDDDEDGLPNDYEQANPCLDPSVPDSDQDPDEDGLTNLQEVQRGTDPCVADTDGDGLNDGDEVARGTQPTNPDSDLDGLTDGDEVLRFNSNPLDRDTDGDGLPDGIEVRICGTPRCANPTADSDGDQLINLDEVELFTDPMRPDTDNDTIRDGEEVIPGTDGFITDPLNPDTDEDGVGDGDEVALGFDPQDPGSTPTIDPNTGPKPDRVVTQFISVLNTADPPGGDQPPQPDRVVTRFISVLNTADPPGGDQPPQPDRVVTRFTSVLNTADPPGGDQPPQPDRVVTRFTSVLNTADPPGGDQPPQPDRVVSPFISIENVQQP